MTAFGAEAARVAEALATEPEWSVAGTFTPAGGASVSVRIIPYRQDEVVTRLGDTRSPGRGFLLQRTSALTTAIVAARPTDTEGRPRTGDLLVVEGVTYRILDAQLDSSDTEWALNVDPAV